MISEDPRSPKLPEGPGRRVSEVEVARGSSNGNWCPGAGWTFRTGDVRGVKMYGEGTRRQIRPKYPGSSAALIH
ncbi:hypothetical protein EMCRGX_G022604 [Ephydatia muelleri]